MAPRKSQKDNTQGYSRGPPRKRARRDSSLVESQAHYQSQRNVQDSDQDQVTRTVPELISRESASWSAAIDSFEREPMSSQVQRYKDWRRMYLLSVDYGIMVDTNQIATAHRKRISA